MLELQAIPTEFDNAMLESDDQYAEYFKIVNHALTNFLNHSQEMIDEDALTVMETKITKQYCLLLLNTLGAMRLRYLHDEDNSLHLDMTLSGFPNFNEMRYIVNDLEAKETRLQDFPEELELKEHILQHIMKRKEHVPKRLLHKASLFKYYSSIDADNLFHRFTQGKIVQGVDSDRIVSWSFYDISANRTFLCFLHFDITEKEIDTQALYTSIQKHGYRLTPLEVMANQIDVDIPNLKPKMLKCLDMGPLFSTFAKDEHEITHTLLEGIKNKELSPNAFALKVRVDVLKATGEREVKKENFLYERTQILQTYTIANREMGSTYHHEYVFAPHRVLQLLSDKLPEFDINITKAISIDSDENN